MIDKITIVTDPDDIQINGVRILLFDLNQNQNHIISNALTNLETIPSLIIYSWKQGDNLDWLIDKIYKSQYFIFNAESYDQQMVGFLASKTNSSYFGNLKSLDRVNKSAIFDEDQCRELLISIFNYYGQ